MKAYDYLLQMEEKQIFSEEDIQKICQYSKSSDSEIRMMVAELLCNAKSELAKQTLIYLLNDSDFLVRVSACDSLGNFMDKKIVNLLLNVACTDLSELVRFYALLSVGDISFDLNLQETKQILFDCLKDEKNEFTLIAYYFNLYRLGCHEFLDILINNLSSEDYHTRICVLKCLEDILTVSNKSQIYEAVIRLKNNEKTRSVTEAVEHLILKYNTL